MVHGKLFRQSIKRVVVMRKKRTLGPTNLLVFRLFVSLITVLLFFGGTGYSLEVPSRPANYVTDMAGLLTSQQISTLDKLLASFESKTSNQIAILIVKSLEGENLEDFSIRVAETWKLGQKDKDNGILLFIALKERKIRIEVGYGLEGVVPDGLAGSIIRHEIGPYFRKGQYYQGLEAGLRALMSATAGEYRPTAKSKKTKNVAFSSFIFFILILFFIISRLFGRRRYRRSSSMFFWGGGGFGGGFGGGGFGGGFSGGGGGFGGGGASGGW